MSDDVAITTLNVLITYPELEYDAEFIAAAIAERWPANVVAFIGERQTFARTDAVPSRYDAVPFAVYQLQSPLSAVPDIMLAGAHTWFETDPLRFPYDGGKLLSSVFPDLSNGLEARLMEMIASGNDQDLAFVLGVLSAFEGKPPIYELVRTIIAVLDTESQLLGKARSVLRESGVVCGEFGFADLHAGRKAMLEAWLTDPSETVRIFAAEQIRELDRQIAAEIRSAEASIALRKLEYGEELDDREER